MREQHDSSLKDQNAKHERGRRNERIIINH